MPRAVWNGAIIADSDNVEVVDGYTYFLSETVDHRHLQRSDHHSICPWKGRADYYDVVVDGDVNPAAAWEYPQPSNRAAPLVSGRIAFWRGVTIERHHATGRRGVLERLTSRRR